MALREYSLPYTPALPEKLFFKTTLEVRSSPFQKDANKASEDFMKEWKKHHLPSIGQNFIEMLCPCEYGHLASLTLPEIRPDRIEGIVFILDLILASDALNDYHDGETLSSSRDEPEADAHAGLAMLTKTITSHIASHASSHGDAFVKAFMDYWASLKTWRTSQLQPSGTAFAEQFPIRYFDYLSPLAMPIIEYALGLTLNSAERETLHFLNFVANTGMILWNDIYSWPKEKMECEEGRIPSVCSTISIFMEDLGCDSGEAMALCRQQAFQYERFCQQTSRELVNDPSSTLNVQKVADAYPLFLSGGALWFRASPRYEVATVEMDKMRAVCSEPIPSIGINGEFEKSCHDLYRACSALEHNILSKE